MSTTGTPTTTTVSSSTVTTTTSPVVSTSVFVPPPPVFPSRWAGLRPDPREVGLFSTETGEPVWLIADTDQGPFYGASLVRMGPGHLTYVETCCEPAAGAVYAVDSTGQMGGGGPGYFPAPSPDGRWLASTSQAMRLDMFNLVERGRSFAFEHPLDGRVPIPDTDPIALSNLTWSLDATRLVFNYHTGTAVPSLLVVDPFTATSLADATVLFEGGTTLGEEETAPAWYLPAFTDLGLLVAESEMHAPFDVRATVRGVIIDPITGEEVATIAYQPGRVVDQDTDPSGRYLIYVLDDGSVHWLSTDGERGVLAEEGFSSASW